MMPSYKALDKFLYFKFWLASFCQVSRLVYVMSFAWLGRGLVGMLGLVFLLGLVVRNMLAWFCCM